MLNHISVMGRLTNDPTFSVTAAGTQICIFTVACERDYRSEKSEIASDYIRVVVRKKLAEDVGKTYRKGNLVVISGRLQMYLVNEKNSKEKKYSQAEIVAEDVYLANLHTTEGGF